MDQDAVQEDLRQLGFAPQYVARGMEGLIFSVGGGALAKVWHARGGADLQVLRSFYSELRQRHLPYQTPRIDAILETPAGRTVSIEERLPGVPLRDLLDGPPHHEEVRLKGMAAVVSVVRALGTIDQVPAARDLILLGERSPWTAGATWGTVLSDVVARRAGRYTGSLTRCVPDLAHTVAQVVALLRALDTDPLGVIHGDICPENVLVDPTTVLPTALLDFGFLTTAGDPQFDATLSTLFYDMYSPRSHATRERLHALYTPAWGQQFVTVYPLYKAAYALATSNAYSEEGQDGHFRWCVDILNDKETHALVGHA